MSMDWRTRALSTEWVRSEAARTGATPEAIDAGCKLISDIVGTDREGFIERVTSYVTEITGERLLHEYLSTSRRIPGTRHVRLLHIAIAELGLRYARSYDRGTEARMEVAAIYGALVIESAERYGTAG